MTTRILIADDDPSIRLLLRRLLENNALWEVREAANGSEALEKTIEWAPDLVILDLAMPGMNGLQAARQISKNGPHPPLLLVSVQQVTSQLARAAWESGFRGAITKSKGTEVVRAIEALLSDQVFFMLEDSYPFPLPLFGGH